ncbi:MAG: class I SAM-dependent methyltransferase [Candidatus Limnocylindrales bacterium]
MTATDEVGGQPPPDAADQQAPPEAASQQVPPDAAGQQTPPDGADYALLDAGDGRRLERFGAFVVDRPAPAAQGPRRTPERWTETDARSERDADWVTLGPPPDPWEVRFGRLTFRLRLTASGQVGLFPEQAPNWDWIGERLRAASLGRRPAVLNLFAYTGGATLAAAAAGAQVVHVDAVRSALAWARENAAASGLADAPIRWIPDDAVRFAEREVRRGHTYELVVLDPPSYGQGPGGERWRLVERLPELLATCLRLLAQEPLGLLLSAHTAGLSAGDLGAAVRAALAGLDPNRGHGRLEALPLTLIAESGAQLPAGAVARWTP